MLTSKHKDKLKRMIADFEEKKLEAQIMERIYQKNLLTSTKKDVQAQGLRTTQAGIAVIDEQIKQLQSLLDE